VTDKLPSWFLVPTPLGNYNPDWAIVRNEHDGDHLYLVRETKGTDQIGNLQWETEEFTVRSFLALQSQNPRGNKPYP